MEKIVPEGAESVNPELKIFPGYNSAVNAVTKPNKIVCTSQYFVDRWMPLLGGNGTMIVLALRHDGFLNRRTGERRDEIPITRPELAARAGISKDTLTRELGDDKETGKPNNPWLRYFVQPRHRYARNARGQVQQIANAYWVSMDDPIHPDDWHLVEAAAEADGWRRDKIPDGEKTKGCVDKAPQNADAADGAETPGMQNAFPVEGSPEMQNAFSAAPEMQSAADATQNASPGMQTALSETQNASPKTQNASALILDSSLPRITLTTTTTLDTQAGANLTGASSPTQAEEVGVVLGDFLVWEDQDEDAVIEALRLEALASVSEDAPAPAPEPMPLLAAPLVTPPDAPLVTADTDRAVRRAASDLADASGLRQCDLDDYISAWRADGLSDDDIAQVLAETNSVMAAKQPPPRDPKAFAAVVLANKVKAIRNQAQASPESSLDARITGKLSDLPVVKEADLDAIRGRFQALDEGDRKEINRRASLLVRDAAGSEAAYKSIPDAEHRALMARVKPALFLAWEQAIAARPKPEVMQAGVANLRDVMVNLGLKEKGENV